MSTLSSPPAVEGARCATHQPAIQSAGGSHISVCRGQAEATGTDRHASQVLRQARPQTDSLASGKPRFNELDIDRTAATEGGLAAWKCLFAKYGAACAEKVAGDFAVGFTDERGVSFAAVDRFARNSLCYRIDGGRIRFSPNADELTDDGSGIDPQAIFDYLYFHVIPSPRTIFKGVFRLPPGHCLILEHGELRITRYWQAQFVEGEPVAFGQLAAEFRRLLRQAVARQLDGSKPASFLSGGTDSSTVAGMIGQVCGRPAATYSIGFDAEGYDEMAYARIAAKHFSTEHHEYYVTPDDLVQSIPAVAAHYDQPFGNSSALPAYYCARMARDDGVSLLLAGDGGDELFGGNSRYAKSKLFDCYHYLPGALSKVMEPVLAGYISGRLPLLRKLRSYVEQARVPMPDRLQMYNLVMRLGLDRMMTPELLSRVDIEQPLLEQRKVWLSVSTNCELNRELAYDWRYTLAENDLPKVCGTSRLAGLSVAFPMLDDDLLSFSLSLPSAYKLKGLKLRWFFKEALRGFLPEAILAKKKQGFGLPFGVWLCRHPRLNELASESVRSLVERGILQGDFVETLLGQRLSEHPGYYGEMVWISMMLEQWLRVHAPRFSLKSD